MQDEASRRFLIYAKSHGWSFNAIKDLDLKFDDSRIIFPITDWMNRETDFWVERRHFGEPRWMPMIDPVKAQTLDLQSDDDVVSRVRDHLYGLGQHRMQIARTGLALVVESAACVVALKGLGFPIGVATMGTGMTQRQARVLRRYTRTIIIWSDRGPAGEQMTHKVRDVFGTLGGIVGEDFSWGLDPSDTIAKDRNRVGQFLLGALERNGLGENR